MTMIKAPTQRTQKAQRTQRRQYQVRFVFSAISALFAFSASGISSLAQPAPAPAPTTQLSIDRVDLMPDRPQPFKYKDFKSIARGLDKLLFDFEQKGQYLPLIWWDDTRYNVDLRGFGFPSYPGRPVQTKGHEHESITTMGALLGATLAGID